MTNQNTTDKEIDKPGGLNKADKPTDKSKSPATIKPIKLNHHEKQFVNLVANGYSLKQAYIRSFPAKKHLKDSSIRQQAWKLYARSDIRSGVDVTQARLSALADKAVHRLDEIITDGKEHNALQASTFVTEQQFGKATQRIESTSKVVSVNIDLTGSLEEN